MKIGVRKVSISKSISARTKGRLTRSIKRKVVPFYGKAGLIKNPKKAIYNKVYNKTTVDPLEAGTNVLTLSTLVLLPLGSLFNKFFYWAFWLPLKYSILIPCKLVVELPIKLLMKKLHK